MQRAVLFLAASAVAASGLAACRRGALDGEDAGGSGGATLTGSGGATPAGSGGATPSGSGGATPAGAGGAGGAGGEPTTACQGGAPFSYLVRSLAAADFGDADVLMHGFDLDGRVSDGAGPEDCGVADRTSPDGRAGIDNTVGGFWSEDFAHRFDGSYAQGEGSIVIRLSGVDSFDNDDCVQLEWFEALWVGSPIDPASPEAAGRQLRQVGPIAHLPGAQIAGGRLLARGAAPIALHGSFGALVSLFPLVLSRIGFVVSADALTQGELGGSVKPDDVYRLYGSVYGSSISPDLIASILRLDLPSGQSPCALLSAGFGFEAVRVTIVP